MLVECIRHDRTGEIHEQHDSITKLENEERCLRRATGLMAALAGVALVGAGYSILLLKDVSTGDLRTILLVFTVLGVTSTVCLLAFGFLWSLRRYRLGEERDRLRHLALKLMANSSRDADAKRLGAPALLLIEDQENDVFFLRQAFSRLGAKFNIQVVNNGHEAQRYLRGEGKYSDRRSYPSPAVIVCDFQMPQCNGIEFMRWFRSQEEFEGIPFVSLSGTVLPEQVQLAKESGATLCLEKTADFAKTLDNAKAIIGTAPSS